MRLKAQDSAIHLSKLSCVCLSEIFAGFCSFVHLQACSCSMGCQCPLTSLCLHHLFEASHDECCTRRNIGKKARPAEPEELPFSAPAQRLGAAPSAAPPQHQADQQEPPANRGGTETQTSNVSETARQGGQDGEQASAPRRRTGHEEITDLAYEAAEHTQDFAEEIEDAVRPFKLPMCNVETACALSGLSNQKACSIYL